jgi:hypothetical protein
MEPLRMALTGQPMMIAVATAGSLQRRAAVALQQAVQTLQ